MNIEEIYRNLEYHHLDDDTKQEIAIKLWNNLDGYDESRGAFSTWVSTVVKHHKISKWRKANPEIPMTEFDFVGKYDGILNAVLDKLYSDEPSPESGMIYQEERERLLERIYELPDSHKETLMKYIDGKYDGSNPSDRSKLHRAKKALVGKKGRKYRVINAETNKEFVVDSLEEASKITGVSIERCRQACKKGGLFAKKLWRITEK